MNFRCFVLPALLLVFSLTAALQAMPPHPDLVARIRAGEIEAPYYLSHRAEILARGVDSPPAHTVDILGQRALDENLNLLAILVDFDDNVARVSAENFDELIFEPDGRTLRNYYSEISYGNLTLVTVNMPSALDWQRAPQNYGYYVNGQNGFGDYPRNAQGLARAAVLMVDPIVNFANYDHNGDGMVDGLFIIHAGPGAELTGNNNHIWSHMWSMPEVAVDGVTASVYSMEPEYWQLPGDMTCGVYAHEMGHSVFFLPDLYDYGYDSEGLGRWSLMAGGSWNGQSGNSPAHPDAQSRVQMGFVDPIRITTSLLDIAIPPVAEQPVIYELWTDGLDNPEHFLVENRQRTGYDVPLPGEGLLIYHVDENMGGNDDQWYPGHEDAGHFRVALEQADGQWHLEHNAGGDAADPFPGLTNNRAFKASSTPDSRDYNGQDTQVAVRRIHAQGDTMIATLLVNADDYVFVNAPMHSARGGAATCVPVNVENDVTGRNITSFSFTLTYDPALLAVAAPYFSRDGGIVPAGWSITESHTTPGVITISGSGATPLAGQGSLLCLQFEVLPTAPDEAVSPLNFTNFTITGNSPVDTTSGSLLVEAPRIIAYPFHLDFEPLLPGQSHRRPVVLRNLGHAPLRVDSLRVSAPFSHDFTSERTLEPNTWSIVMITFAPQSEQWFFDTLQVYSNNPDGPAIVALFGQGGLGADNENPAALPREHYLSQNYPNPFNPSTEFRFGLPVAGDVSLKVYNVLGREVATLADGRLEAGHHQAVLDGRNLSAGVYLAVLRGDNFSVVRKAMLIK